MKVDQAMPLWDRPSNPRGHTSSVERALQAHRDQVSARNNRTEARLVGAATPVDQFFVSAASAAATEFMPNNKMEDAQMVETPTVSIQSAESGSDGESDLGPMQSMGDLYETLSIAPVRNLAPSLVENEAVENISDLQSDDVPQGSKINYYA